MKIGYHVVRKEGFNFGPILKSYPPDALSEACSCARHLAGCFSEHKYSVIEIKQIFTSASDKKVKTLMKPPPFGYRPPAGYKPIKL